MSNFKYPVFAKEGAAHLIIALLAGVISTWLLGLASIFVWLLVGFVFQFFRDPQRRIPQINGAIVSPASGKIVSISETHNPYQKGSTVYRISVFMNVFSVHSNLLPVSGSIIGTWYHPGKFFNAALSKSSHKNERNAIQIRTDDGFDVFSVQIAGLLARRIFCYVEQGDRVEIGQRYGFIRFGSRVDVYIPVSSNITVKLGQNVQSGNDIIGYLPVN